MTQGVLTVNLHSTSNDYFLSVEGGLAGPKLNILLKHLKEDVFGFVLNLSGYPEEQVHQVFAFELYCHLRLSLL